MDISKVPAFVLQRSKLKKVTNDMTEVTERLLDLNCPSPEITKEEDDTLACCGPAARAALAAVTDAAESRSKLYAASKDVTQAITQVQESEVIIHIHPGKLLELLTKDTHYRNQFETNTSSGTLSHASRNSWEALMFGNAYQKSAAFDKVKYGCLQLGRKRGDPVAARTYGDSYLRLKSSVKTRCTMTVGDSGGARSTDDLATFDHCAHVVSKFEACELAALAKGVCGPSEGKYKEVQIHGPIRLQDDVEALVLHENHRSSPRIMRMAESFGEKFGVQVSYMDEL